ncbi:MAG: recombination protein O N-terminal domain-containing protein [Candidatus Paceibacterota bacterium]
MPNASYTNDMEYRLYTTPAFVLARAPSGEANSTVWLLTRDLGLIRATAQAARRVASKHRYGLQTFALAVVSVVRGKGGWRITSVVPHRSYHSRLSRTPESVDVAAKLALALRLLCAGEARQPELFALFHEAMNVLSGRSLSADRCRSVECVALVRILARLGYIGDDAHLAPFIGSVGYSQPLIAALASDRSRVTRAINEAFAASHLVDARYA